MRQDDRRAEKRVLAGFIAVLGVLAMLLIVSSSMAGVAAAQQDGTGTNVTVNGTSETAGPFEYRLDDVDLRSVEFENSTVVVEAVFNDRATIAVTDSAAVQGTGSHSGGYVPYEHFTRDSGEHTIRMELASDDEIVTVAQGSTMIVDTGDRGVLQILAHSPGTDTVQIAAFAGALGVFLATALAAGFIKRKHHNNYKELLSEERIRVEEDSVDGLVGKITSFFRRHKHLLLSAAGVCLYGVLSQLGVVPTPGEWWASASDGQRVFVFVTLVCVAAGFAPGYWVVTRVWDPATEFVFDLDVRDALDQVLGAKGGLAALEDIEDADDVEDAVEELEDEDDVSVVAVYSGSPERVNQMSVDGARAEVPTPGGPGHLVQDFNPKKNTAEGTWPGLADDFELARERSKIDGNREILEDYATVGRRVIGALPAIRAGADTSAVAAVDRKFGQSVAIDSDPVDDIMDSAVSGTRFERYYSKGANAEEDEYDEDDDTVNDDSDGENGGDEE